MRAPSTSEKSASMAKAPVSPHTSTCTSVADSSCKQAGRAGRQEGLHECFMWGCVSPFPPFLPFSPSPLRFSLSLPSLLPRLSHTNNDLDDGLLLGWSHGRVCVLLRISHELRIVCRGNSVGPAAVEVESAEGVVGEAKRILPALALGLVLWRWRREEQVVVLRGAITGPSRLRVAAQGLQRNCWFDCVVW